MPADDPTSDARGLLERIVDADVGDTEDGPAIRQGVARDRVVSVVDPDMRHGRKSASGRVAGYKAHLLTHHEAS